MVIWQCLDARLTTLLFTLETTAHISYGWQHFPSGIQHWPNWLHPAQFFLECYEFWPKYKLGHLLPVRSAGIKRHAITRVQIKDRVLLCNYQMVAFGSLRSLPWDPEVSPLHAIFDYNFF
jgi:hypothetical protein